MNVSAEIIRDGVKRSVTSFSSTDNVMSSAAATGSMVLLIFLFVFEKVADIAIDIFPFYKGGALHEGIQRPEGKRREENQSSVNTTAFSVKLLKY